MQLYAIRRRNGWATADDLKAAAERSTAEGNKPGSGVRWIRSYVVSEDNGDLGTVCMYEAARPGTTTRAAARSRWPRGAGRPAVRAHLPGEGAATRRPRRGLARAAGR